MCLLAGLTDAGNVSVADEKQFPGSSAPPVFGGGGEEQMGVGSQTHGGEGGGRACPSRRLGSGRPCPRGSGDHGPAQAPLQRPLRAVLKAGEGSLVQGVGAPPWTSSGCGAIVCSEVSSGFSDAWALSAESWLRWTVGPRPS